MSALRFPGRAPLLENGVRGPSWNANVFDLSELTWVSPFDIAVLGLLWARREACGTPAGVVLPTDPAVRAYLVHMGIETVIPGPWGQAGASGIEPPWLPLTCLRTGEDWDEALRTIWPAARTALGTHGLTEHTMSILGELIDNAATHGLSDAGTFVCAQLYSGETSGEPAGVELGVVDGGVGIPQHLRRNPKYSDVDKDSELIRLARKPWVTGTADRRGWGLVEVFDDATAVGPSRVLIRSGRGEGDFRLRVGQNPSARYRDLRPAVPGTWIHVHVNAGT